MVAKMATTMANNAHLNLRCLFIFVYDDAIQRVSLRTKTRSLRPY